MVLQLLVRNKDQHKKHIICSGWLTVLEELEKQLCKELRLQTFRYDGTKSEQLRRDILRQFAEYQGRCCLLLSKQAGGTGLNLTSASHLIMMDVAWNPAIDVALRIWHLFRDLVSGGLLSLRFIGGPQLS